ncbi:MAG TPA: glycosyltransferase family 39 protein, partial [Anaerolineaceae bacterium]|nr:glycosyltransferase family 39 protein [Anaerolineaceae bacterium]
LSTTTKNTGIPVSWTRWLVNDWINAGLLGVLAFLIRLPFRSQVLYHWDSVNFAYAMQEFNLAKDQPQPPGYILYVFLARLVDLIFHDPQRTLVAISLVSSSLAVALIYLLAKELFNPLTGWISAGMLATSPLFWFYSEIALPHTFDTLLILSCVFGLYRVSQGDLRYLYPTVILLSIAGGVRQQTLVFLLPLTLFAFRRIGFQRWIFAGGLGVLACMAWFLPLIATTGGLANYLRITSLFSYHFQDTTSIFLGAGLNGIIHNVRKLAEYTLYAWGPSLLALGVLGASLRIKNRISQSQWGRWIFLAIWVMPALVFYTFVHMGQQGLIFVYLPALLLASAYGLELGLRHLPELRTIIVFALLLFNAAVFCLLPEFPFGAHGIRILNRDSLVASDQYYKERIQAIRENFSPASTLILAVNWHHVEYYLPEYHKITMDAEVAAKELQSLPVPSQGEPLDSSLADWGMRPEQNVKINLVMFDPVIDEFIQSPAGWQSEQIQLPTGDLLRILELKPETRVHLGNGVVAFRP